ncbi:MAG TPA: thiol reductant ABC exporter subunit CydC [Thermoleophilaceae bacterium]
MIRTLRRLLAFAGAPRGRMALAVSLGALTVVFGAGLMGLAGYLISRAAERPAILSLTVAIVGVRFFGIGRPLMRYLERLTSHDVALRVLGRARVRVWRRIEPLAPTQLEGYRDGDLLSRMVADVDALQNLQLRGIGPPFVALLAGAVCVGVSAAFLPAAALVLGVGLGVAAVAVPALAGALGRRAAERQAAARGELSAELVELLDSAPELVVNGAADARLARLHAADRTLVSVARRDALAGGVADAVCLLLTGVTVAAVLAVAVNASAHGDLDRVLIAMLALLALASFEAIQPLSAAARELAATLAAGRRLLEVTAQEPRVVDPAQPLPAPPSGPVELALEDVRASYGDGGELALDGVSLRLPPGRKIALVGPSGSGKTTVANLMLRFLDPNSGRVTLAGRDLRNYRQEDVRRAIAVAGQESHLFSTSIRENVRLARPEASDPDIEAALRRARIWDWVAELPDGWHTHVGEGGRELSGGQRQRVALARALLADAPVLVLDEPTAHLDSETADDLVLDVLAAAGERSVLLITHRPEGLGLVDEIVTLRSSRIEDHLIRTTPARGGAA